MNGTNHLRPMDSSSYLVSFVGVDLYGILKVSTTPRLPRLVVAEDVFKEVPGSRSFFEQSSCDRLSGKWKWRGVFFFYNRATNQGVMVTHLSRGEFIDLELKIMGEYYFYFGGFSIQ